MKENEIAADCTNGGSYEAVEYCYEQGLVSGLTNTEFGPDANIRRGDFLLMLYRAAGSPEVTSLPDFPDVAPTDYYAAAIAWAQENGLASGMEDGTFAPNINVTREQAFTLLRRALPQLNILCADADLSILRSAYNDADTIADYAKPHIATLTVQGLVNGTVGAVSPQGNLTWAQTAALLYRLSTFVPVTADVEAAETTAVCLVSDYLNVRLAPASDASIIGVIPGGSEVIITESLEGWYRVLLTNDSGALLVGYASADYLELQ